jgi:hypothetical protein
MRGDMFELRITWEETSERSGSDRRAEDGARRLAGGTDRAKAGIRRVRLAGDLALLAAAHRTHGHVPDVARYVELGPGIMKSLAAHAWPINERTRSILPRARAGRKKIRRGGVRRS